MVTVSTSLVVSDVAIPKSLQMQIHLDPVHADIGDDATGRHDILASDKAGGYADRFDGGIDAAAAGHLHDFLNRSAVFIVNDRCRAEAGG